MEIHEFDRVLTFGVIFFIYPRLCKKANKKLIIFSPSYQKYDCFACQYLASIDSNVQGCLVQARQNNALPPTATVFILLNHLGDENLCSGQPQRYTELEYSPPGIYISLQIVVLSSSDILRCNSKEEATYYPND